MSNFASESQRSKTSGDEGAKLSGKTKIIRGALAAFIIFAIVFFAANIVMALIRVDLPTFKINSLSVLNFNATKTQLKAEWDANFTVGNPNHMLGISIAQVDFLLTYSNYAIVSATSEPRLKLGPNEDRIIRVDINRERWRSRSKDVPEPFEEIVEARKNGTLAFNVYMITTSVALSGTWWERKMSKCYECDDLRLQFVSETNGAVMFNSGRTCSI